MKADTLDLQAVFYKPIRYRVPMFQRPYVWEQKRQWEPLWEDMRDLAERLLDGSPLNDDTPHFIGAVVLEQVPQPLIKLESRTVIDGQQRLTTIQILISAARCVAMEREAADEAELLGELIWNDSKLAKDPGDRLKIEPTTYDRAAFDDVMKGVDAPFEKDSDGGLIRGAFHFFLVQLREWTSDAEAKPEAQLQALRQALWKLIQVVVIDLDRDDNAQIIFETLNARGTELLAADLVKNLLFRTALAAGDDSTALYGQFWKPLDSNEWRRKIRQGRLFRPRIDVFVMHWLTMTLGKEVVIHQLYPEFRGHLRSADHTPASVLADLRRYADVYAGFDTALHESAEGRFFYRLEQLDTTTAMPVLLWMFGPGGIDTIGRLRAMRAIESWLVRRMICRLTAKNYNSIFLSLLKELRAAENASDATVIGYLRGLSMESQAWPDDDVVLAALKSQPIYQTQVRKRLRMLLEALEESRGSDLTEQVSHASLTVEHILPQNWAANWPLETDEPEAVERRDEAKHRLGNLTLVTKALNPTLSNAPWQDKRQTLNEWSVLLISADARTAEIWDEAAIQTRTGRLASEVLRIWPGPHSAVWD